jgi:segregation and condensation protein B
MPRRARESVPLDLDLEDLPPPLRWREWMGRVEAVMFAAAEPVTRETLARVVGRACALDLLIDDIREELRGRPYELVAVAGGWRLQTRKQHAEAVQAALRIDADAKALTKAEAAALMAVAYYQPITRGELGEMFGREVSRDLIASLRAQNLIAAGPRSPQPGAPYAYVTTPGFLAQFGFESLRDLPDLERLQDAGLLERSGGADRDVAGAFGGGEDAVDEIDRESAGLAPDKDPERDAA